MKTFEKDGCRYNCTSNEEIDGVIGFHVSKQRWVDDRWVDDKNSQFIPLVIRPTRSKIVDSFKMGTGFIYFSERNKRREIYHASPEYNELFEKRKLLYRNEQKFIEIMDVVGIHEGIAKFLKIHDEKEKQFE